MWREMKDKSIWEEKATKDKERYANEMKNYKPGNSVGVDTGSKKRKKEASPKKTATTMAGGGFKSKEYISDDESSGSDDDKKKKKKKKVGHNFRFCDESFPKRFFFPNTLFVLFAEIRIRTRRRRGRR